MTNLRCLCSVYRVARLFFSCIYTEYTDYTKCQNNLATLITAAFPESDFRHILIFLSFFFFTSNR